MCKCTLEVGVIVADAIARILDRYEVPPMLSMEVAAEKLDVSKETLRSFVNSGELPVVAVTDRIQRIKISDFNVFINGRRKSAVPEAPVESAAPAASEAPVESAAPAASEAPAVERCTAVHPKTGKRCVLAAGHDGKHKLEE